MSLIIIRDGDLVELDPADVAVYTFDWHTDNLADGVAIASHVYKIAAVGALGASIESAIASITRSATTATVTMAAAHGWATGDSVTIAGAVTTAALPVPSTYNGTYVITVTGALTFTFPVSGTPATPAAGTLTAALGLDAVSILSASPYNSRYTQCRFAGTAGIRGAVYEIANRIVTDESPSQAIERSFRVSIQSQ